MGEDVTSDLTLPTLHELDIRLHSGLSEVLREDVGNICVRMETTELIEEY